MNVKMKKIILSAACVFFMNILFAQKILVPQDEDSKVHFVIRNFGIKTGGDLSGLKGTIRFDPVNILVWSFDVTVASSTINTDNETRDKHLKKDDYFDVARHPVLHMLSTKIEATETQGIYRFTGTLTIKGVTKPVQFPFKVNKLKDGYVFSGEFSINRLDFGIGSSSISLADDLKVSLKVFAR